MPNIVLKLINRIQYINRLFKKFGIRSIFFLFISKFKKDPKKEISIKGIKHPIFLSNFKEDVTTLFQIFFAGEYDIQLSPKPKYIIDCGANIGLSAVFFANKYPKAKIIAIEPDNKNFSFLQKNTHPYSNVSCLQKAVWSKSTKMEIVDPGNGGWSLQVKEINSVNGIDSITIDEIMGKFNIGVIDLLKIDIEGAEKELFSDGYQNWISRTKTIAIELHDFLDPEISSVFYKALEPFEYSKYYNGENLICEFNDAN